MIGGGYVGLELAQAMRRFGSKVTVIDRNGRLLHREDDDVTEALHGLFEDEGIESALNAKIKRVSGKSGDSVTVVIRAKWSREDTRRHSSAGSYRPHSKHRRYWIGTGRR